MEEPAATAADNIGARARTAAGWQFLSKGINTALQMVTSIVLARLLMPADFGIVAMATMVTGLAGVFRDLGLGQALVQRQEISEEHTRSAFWGTLVMAVLLYGGIYLSAPHVGAYFDEPRMIPVLRIIALTFVLSPFAVVPRSLLQRDLDFKTPFFAGLAGSVAYGGAGITMALLGYGYWALVFAGLASETANTIALCILTRYLPPLLPTFRGIRALYEFGLGITAIGLLGFISNQADYFVVGRRLKTADLGLYERAFKLVTFPLAVPNMLFSVLFPAFSALQGDRARAHRAFGRLLTATCLLTWPTYSVLLVTAPQLVPLAFGQQWIDAVGPVQVLALSGFARVIADVRRGVTRAMGTRYVYSDAWRLGVYALLVGVGGWFAAAWGAIGVAWCTTTASFVLMALSVQLLHHAIGFGASDCVRALFAPATVAGAAAAFAMLLQSLAASLGLGAWQRLVCGFGGGAIAVILGCAILPQLAFARREIASVARSAYGRWGRVR